MLFRSHPTLTGLVSGAGGLTKTGGGMAVLAGAINGITGGALQVNGGTLAVASGGDVTRMMKVASINVAGGARLDLSDNDVLVDYAGASPYHTLRGYIRSGAIISGTSTGDTVLALADNVDTNRTSFAGVSIDTSTIIGKYTYYGDANLDGKVTGDDYLNVDANLGTGDSWLKGDFNYDGVTTGDDYLAIDANLGKGTTSPLAYAALKEEMVAAHAALFGEEYLAKLAIAEAEGMGAFVPEPAGLAIFALGATLLKRRRSFPLARYSGRGLG